MRGAGLAVLATALATSLAMAGTQVSDLGAIAALIEKDQLNAAEAALRERLAQADDVTARDLLGVTLSRLRRYDQAESEFRQALRLLPDSVAARQHLARLLLLTARDAEAFTELRRAADQGTLERDLAFRLADEEFRVGRVAEAERQWRSLSDRFGSARALLRLSGIESARRGPAAALDILERALEIAPNSEEVLSAYGQMALSAQVPVKAILALEPLVRMNPGVATYPYLAGVAWLQVGDMPRAVDFLEQARLIDPERPLTLIALGFGLNNLKRFDEAHTLLSKSIQIDPDSVPALSALAEALEGLGQLAEAEEHAQRALGKAPSDARANLALGMVRMGQGRFAEARDALARAVAADPNFAKAQYQLSLAFTRLGDPARAAEHLALYTQARKDLEQRLNELQQRTGTPSGGMKR